MDHCTAHMNPADIPTRISNPANMKKESCWFKRPEWPIKDATEWPEHCNPNDLPETCLQEMKSSNKATENTTLLIDARQQLCVSKVIDCKRFSSYERLLRVTAYVIRFIRNCQTKCKTKDELTTAERQKAEIYWIRDIQSNLNKEKVNEVQKQLRTFADHEGVIRCQGRLENADLAYETKNPILLPRDHYVTSLIIWCCHKNVLHSGTKDTLQELRSKYWIIRGRQLVKRRIHKCTLCKKIQGLTYGTPKPSQLPEFRVKHGSAFRIHRC